MDNKLTRDVHGETVELRNSVSHLSNKHPKRGEIVALAEPMEVKVQKRQLVFLPELTLVKQFVVLLGQLGFTLLLVFQQVYDMNFLVFLDHGAEVLLKWLLGHFKRPVNKDIFE